MKASVLAAVALGLMGSVHVACSGSDDGSATTGAPPGETGDTGDFTSSSGGDPSGSSGGDPSSGSSGSAGSSTSGDATSSSGGGGECSAMPDWEQCDACECAKNAAGCEALDAAYEESCLCGATAPCAQACAAYCGGADDDPACDTCAEGLDDTCWDAALVTCDADPACKSFVEASDASCASLPDP